MSRIFPFVLLIVSFGIFMLYIRPTYSGPIQEMRTQISSYNSALDAADHFQQKEAELTQQRAQMPADSLARLESFLPDGVDNVQLILDMDALAARSGVTLSDFSIEGGDTGDSTTANSTTSTGDASLTGSSPVDSITLTFKATGTYPAFRSFLNGIENSLRPLDVVNLSVSESDTGVYSYGMSVRMYWLR